MNVVATHHGTGMGSSCFLGSDPQTHMLGVFDTTPHLGRVVGTRKWFFITGIRTCSSDK